MCDDDSNLFLVGGWWGAEGFSVGVWSGSKQRPPQKVEEDGWIEGCGDGWMEDVL